MKKLLVKDLGRMDYLAALALQEKLVELRRAGEVPDTLMLLEHPDVFTIGRGGKREHALLCGDTPLYRTSRGGDITYHGPGQLIAYPIIDLRSKLRRAVHSYLRRLERVMIATLQTFGISASRKPPWTGIWLGQRKIASIGIAVRRGVTFHGVALNLSPDLSYFQKIVPCGLSWAETTSMEKELEREVSIETVRDEFLRQFARHFGYSELKELCLEDIPIGSRSDPLATRATCASSEF
jgi:lipoate-protein ligase B